MSTVTKRIRLTQFASIRDRGGTDEGTGGGWNNQQGELHMPIGRAVSPSDPTIYRALVKSAGDLFDFSPFYRLVTAKLWVRTTEYEQHVTWTAPSVDVRRITAAWTYEQGSEGSWSASHAVVVSPATTDTGKKTKTHGIKKATWRSIAIPDIVLALAPTTIVGPDGSTIGSAEPWYGLEIRATDESTVDDAVSYASPAAIEARAPYIELVLEKSTAPDAPTITSPATDDDGVAEPVASTEADTLTVAGTASDPDAGQIVPTQQVQVCADAATDASPGTALEDETFSGLVNDFSVELVTTTLTPRTPYRARCRSYDGKWGPWSPLAGGRFELVYQPGVPANPYFGPYGTDGNTIYASLDSTDPDDYITASEVEVYEDPASGGAITKWAPGEQSVGGTSRRVAIAYGGSQLVVGRIVRWRIRLANSDGAWSAWTPWQYVLIEDAVGPSGMSPTDTETKLLTRTPALTIGHGASFDAHEVWLYAPTGELLHDSGIIAHSASQSQSFVVPAGLFDWGDRPQWEAGVRLVGASAIGTRSPRYTIGIASLPAAPLVTVEA